MKRLTYAQLENEYQRLQRAESVLSLALHLALHTRPDATERVRISKGEYYVLKLYGGRRADGGTVVMSFHCKGQNPQSSAHLLEDLQRSRDHQEVRIACAVDRLVILRNRLYLQAEEL